MLTPDQLAHCSDSIVSLYSQLNETIIRDMARRIAKTAAITETGRLQLAALQNLGVLHADLLQSISKYNNMSSAELLKIFADSSQAAVDYDSRIYRQKGLDPLPLNLSPAAMQILEAGYKKTAGNLANLTMTSAVSTQTKFIQVCTLAEMKAESGAFSAEQAIFDAVKELASEGATVIYPSGHQDKMDVAVRRNVMTGVGQTTGEICLQYAEDLGWDLMEISAHAGARPSHAAWQGQIVSLSGKPGYLSKEDIGYGTGAGFKGWNCRHDWYPYLEGSKRMYSSQELAALEEKNIEFPDGSMHTFYEAEQYQRALERKIRESKRILAAEDEWMKHSISEEANAVFQREFDIQALKLKKQEKQLKEFCDKTDLRMDSSRVRTVGFGKSTSQKAVHIDKAVTQVNELYKTDFGHVDPYKVYELDQAALKEKRLNFSSRFKNSGNIAVMEYDDQYYYAHSMANASDGVETPAYTKYKGDKSHLAVTSDQSDERSFETFDVAQSTGKKALSSDDEIRYKTYYDTEAKLLESLDKMWYSDTSPKIIILSERGMCDSCKYVVEQFKKRHPKAKINVVSGVQNTGDPWKGRKYHGRV